MPLDLFIFGDSNTAGMLGGTGKLLKKKDTWPYLLREYCEGARKESPQLAVRSCSVDGLPGRALSHANPQFGVTDGREAWESLLQKMEAQQDAAAKTTVVVVSMGTNDLGCRGSPGEVFEALCAYFRQARERIAAKFPGRDLFLLYVGHPGMDAARMSGDFKEAFGKCEGTQAEFLRLTETLPEQDGLGGGEREGRVLIVPMDGLDRVTDLGPDGLHFTKEAHVKVAQAVFGRLKAAVLGCSGGDAGVAGLPGAADVQQTEAA